MAIFKIKTLETKQIAKIYCYKIIFSNINQANTTISKAKSKTGPCYDEQQP